MVEVSRVKSLRAARRKPFGLSKSREVAADFRQRFQINVNLMSQLSQIGYHPFGGRVGNSVAGSSRGAVKCAHTPGRRVHIDKLSQPNGAVRVQFQRLVAHHFSNGGDQRAGAQGGQKATWVLDIERIYIWA